MPHKRRIQRPDWAGMEQRKAVHFMVRQNRYFVYN